MSSESKHYLSLWPLIKSGLAVHYKRYSCVFLAGSSARDPDAVNSDIDIIVLSADSVTPARRSYWFEGRLFDTHYHDFDSLNHVFQLERKRGPTEVTTMITTGIPLPNRTAVSDRLQAVAAKYLSAGPTGANIAVFQYELSLSIRKLVRTPAGPEKCAVAIILYNQITRAFLVKHQRFIESSLYNIRTIEQIDRLLPKRLQAALADIFEKNCDLQLIQLAQEVVEMIGGGAQPEMHMEFVSLRKAR